MKYKKHYDKDYFKWQSKIGVFGAEANKIKFNDLMPASGNILDFGCGGGYMLASFENINKYGVEINEEAINIATQNGLKIFKSSKDLPDNYFDLIISNNALDHTENPLWELKELYRSLKKDGKICIVVSCRNKTYLYDEFEKDYIFYSFAPSNLGNILNEAGFKVLESKSFIYKWVPFHILFQKLFGWKIFNLACKIYGRISNKWWQTRAVAIK